VGDTRPPTRADALVIGSGAGGAPVAAVLAEAGLEVLVLEAGPRLGAADFSADEAEMTFRLGRAALTRDGAQQLYAGACVGGSTVVNDALCWRTPPEVLERWRREHGLTPLSDAAFAPFVERAWRDLGAAPGAQNRNARALELGARRLGLAGGAVARGVRGCAGLGRCNMGCPIEAKQSMPVTYLPRAERAGARVAANLRAERVLVEAGAARGVVATRLDPETRRPQGELAIRAPRVCVAAGVLGSAALLARSGLAPERTGAGLQLHSSHHVTARFAEPIHAYYGPTMAYAISEWSDVDGRGGPGFMLENVPAQPLVTASSLPGFGDAHARVMEALPHLARCVVLLRDRARGRVRLDEDGEARFDYALAGEDLERLRAGLAAAARVYLAAGAEEVHLPVEGLAPVRREADLAALDAAPLDPSRLAFLYAVHLFGGAVMGGDRASSTCDPEGRSWDARGLWVSDASALPTNTGVNPQVTIVANALRVAEGIAAEGTPA